MGSWRHRACAVALAGAATLIAAALLAPHCLGDPFVDLDPLLRDIWLSNVKEAQPLFRLWAEQPNSVVAFALPVLIGLACAGAFVFSQTGLSRRRWAVVASAIAIGFAAGLWQVRVFTSVAPIAAIASAIAAVAVVNGSPRRSAR